MKNERRVGLSKGKKAARMSSLTGKEARTAQFLQKPGTLNNDPIPVSESFACLLLFEPHRSVSPFHYLYVMYPR